MNVQFLPRRFAHLPSCPRNIKEWLASALPSKRAVHLFKGCQTVGEFEDKLGQMRDQCKGNAAYVQFLRETVLTAKEKEATVGSGCPFFQTKARCPFAKDTIGKPILSPDYIVVCVIL